MVGLLIFVHVVVCVLLIIVVLLQSGKSADLAGAFGGYGSQSTFGPRGTASFLSKMTSTLAILFMVTSLMLWIFSAKKSGVSTVMHDTAKQEQGKSTQKPGSAPAKVPAPVPAEKQDKNK